CRSNRTRKTYSLSTGPGQAAARLRTHRSGYVTSLDTPPRPGGAGAEQLGAGPAVPTAHALAAHRPLSQPGAHLDRGVLHDWQERHRAARLPLAPRQLQAGGDLDNRRLAPE